MTHAQNPAAPSALPDTDPAGQLLLSHDLRSALARLTGAVHLLEASVQDEAGKAHLSGVKATALYMAALLDQAAGGGDEARITDLSAIFAQLEGVWSSAAAQKGLRFEIDLAPDLPQSLRLPQIDFIRIFNNIIGNAVKFVEQGTITVRAARGLGGDLLIEVLDEGAGFSPSAKAQLFSLHGRPEGNRESGSGFGLFIARSLMETAGGRIEAENQAQGGARVILRFPEDLQMMPAPPPRIEETPRPGLPDLSHLKILLAEDNPTNQLVATQMLGKMNAVVELADDGVEALERFAAGDYNLGLIDIEMPRKSGLEVLREIRARPDEKAGVKLLALTAYVLPEHRERILSAGADGIIAKPLTDIAAFGHAILNHTGQVPPKAASAQTGGEIDFDIYNGLKEIIGKDSMQELLDKVQNDLTSVQSGVQAGIQAKDSAPIRAQTHILISVAGAIGAVDLQRVAEALNAKAKDSNWEEITPLAARCMRGLSEVLEFVKQELGR